MILQALEAWTYFREIEQANPVFYDSFVKVYTISTLIQSAEKISY